MVLASWTTPDLSAVLSSSFTSIAPIEALNDQNDQGKFVIFSDSRFESTLNTVNIFNGDYTDLQTAFDGYTLYSMMKYCYVEGQPEDVMSRGLFFGIPIRGWTGWLCTTTDAANDEGTIIVNTNCESRFVPSSDFLAGQTGDLYEARTSDLNELDDASIQDYNFVNGNWICNGTYDAESETVTTECTSWLPSEDDTLTHPSIYRFQSGNEYSVYGYVRDERTGDDVWPADVSF